MLFVGPTPAAIMQVQRDLLVQDVVNMMDDAVDQLGKIKDAKAKADDAAGKKDWNQAALWTEQIWQYQVKAADLGLRAKTYLEQNGAKKVK